ncbi:MAG: hypothetical protein J6L92_02600 [Clostridia bacterium]|nr:hypothetical protein [Clostridia bacterium]
MSKYIDKPLEAYMRLDLELAERTGLALREMAKTAHLSFDRNVLPMVRLGHKTALNFAFPCGMEGDVGDLEDGKKEFPESAEELDRYIQYFKGYRREAVVAHKSEAHKKLEGASAEWAGGWGGHSNPDFGRIVNLGTEGVRKILEEYRQKNTDDCDWFYRGCEYALDAIDIVGERLHQLAVEEEEGCEDPIRKKRLQLAAKAFEVVPKKPAYDFTSACHVFWMLFTMDGIDSPGRFDQYMWRAYSISEDKDEVDDMLRRIWDVFHDTRSWNLCLSGSDENWNDETNELTYHILKLAGEKLYDTPNVTLRVHRNTPEKLWRAIADTLATGIGMPALYNDEVVCPALEKIGIPPCDSHDYCMNGCNQIDIMGKSHMGLEDGEVLFCKCLEFALYDGKDPLSGEVVGLPTGDAAKFKTYQELEQAFMRQLDYVTYTCCATANAHQHMRGMYSPNPFRSCLIEGCLEKGRDYRNGGPLYGHGQILAEGIADTGDSLWALKKLVFDEKKYTMEQVIAALDADFEGYEEMRRDFLQCEKFGNDCEAVDEITSKAVNRFLTVLKRNHTYRGGVFTGGCSTYTRAAGYGRSIGALPNGRKRRDPILADSIGAEPGKDANGPTALIKSVLCFNHVDSGSGFVFQTKYDKKIINTEKGKDMLIALAKTYFAGGGQQFTVTVVDPKDLIDAQKNPEAHKDLIVRVGGYSDHFINLEKGLQDNIIARTNIELD